MDFIEIGGSGYTQISLHSTILLNEEQLDSFIASWNRARENDGYSGSLEDFCSYCLTVGANVYLLQIANTVAGSLPERGKG